MARVAEPTTYGSEMPNGGFTPSGAQTRADVSPAGDAGTKDKVLPLPRWLKKLYFIFPVVLYVPDVIFNYYVYSNGLTTRAPNPVLQVFYVVLWSFLSVGVVGMAYLLSVLAPWHWGKGHHMQAFFCAIGVIIATGITTWNSLSYRSTDWIKFPTDQWMYSIWPQLQANHISVTMILVAVAPPFWGLFWAVVQPTETGRTLGQIQESHRERLLRMQQEAELKQLRAETSAKVREAQLRGMASTAAAARQQAAGLLGRGKAEERQPAADEQTDETPATGSTDTQGDEPESGASKVLQYPVFTPGAGREAVNGHGLASFHNHAAAATPSVHSAPAAQAHTGLAQPALLANADVHGAGGLPSTDGFTFTPRRPASFSGTLTPADDMEDATGTTGPRPAIRRANEPGILTRGLNEPNPAHVQAVHEVMRSLNIPTSKRSLSRAQMDAVAPSVAERLTVDETSARTLINRVLKAEGQRTSQA